MMGSKVSWKAGEIEGFDGRGVAVDVILEVLTEEAGAVPGQAAGAWLEEEARAFDAAEREDVLACAEDGFDAGEGAAAEADGGVAFGDEFDGARVQPEVDVGMGGEGLVVEAGEVWLGAPAREIRVEALKLGEGQAEVAPDGLVASLDFGEAFELERSLVERGQFGLGEWPAAVRNARAWGEVAGVELEDLASPTDGRAALHANAARVDAAMGQADDLAVVDGLRGVFANGPAAFKEQHFFAFAGELNSEGDAGGPCTGDADVCDEAGLRSVV